MGRKKSSTKERRRTRRKPVNWVGHYWVRGSVEESRSPCMVLDAARDGAGLVLFGGVRVQESQQLVIAIERLGATPVMLRLRGTVRHVGARTADGGLRIGVQLAMDDPHEQRIAKMLFGT